MMNNTLSSFGRAGLYLTVFLTGASVMVIELLGSVPTKSLQAPAHS